MGDLGSVERGRKVRAYGLSTGDVASARAFAKQTNGVAIQHGANVLQDAPELFDVAAEYDLANIINSPLAMGILRSGKFTESVHPAVPRREGQRPPVACLLQRRPADPEFLDRLDAIREILTSGGRTLVQGALAWLWARSPRAIPIPGFKNVSKWRKLLGARVRRPVAGAGG